MTRALRSTIGNAVFIAAFIALWEYASMSGWLDRTFFGRPSGIASYLWTGFVVGRNLWNDFFYTIAAASIAFSVGSTAAILVGLVFATLPSVHRACEPYLALLNAMPRIALAPLFLLWFGLGIGSKIAVGISLAFFIVLSSTVAGIKGVNSDHLVLSRALGAKPGQIFFKVTLPSAVPIIFSGLRLGLVYSLLGVVAAELLAAEHGLGQVLAYLQSTFDMDGVMALLFLLAMLGLSITIAMNWFERKLLVWQ
jgi:NitT/TauT family transport system permease protein